MMEDTMMAVTSLKGAMIGSVRVLVKFNTKLNDILNIMCSFTYEGVNSFNVILEASGNESIVLVILDIVCGGIVNSCDTALCKRRVAKRQVTLA